MTRVLAFLLLVILAVGAGAYMLKQPKLAARYLPAAIEWLADSFDRPSVTREPVAFAVRPGETGADVANRLTEAGAIGDPRVFRYLLSFYGAEAGLRAGEYRLTPADGTRAMVQQLLGGGSDKLVSVTVPEGLRAEEVAALIEQAGVAPKQDFLQLVFSGRSPLPALPANAAGSLEGYLFPETYNVPPNYGAEPMLRFMLETFRDRAWPEVQQAAAVGLTPQQALVLASIVEREAAVAAERPVLAGVFLNRLRINMPLAADPTVQYMLVPPGAPTPPVDGYWKRDLTFQDLRVPSPYNTYVTAGLPPAPIANPGLGSIRGVVAPTPSDFLFFVARPDHSHALAVTFEEHLANVRRYQP